MYSYKPPDQNLSIRGAYAPWDKLMSHSTSKKIESPKNDLVCLRLLIADDQPRVRQSLEALLTALRWSTPNSTGYPIEIVGDADDGQ